MKKIFYLLAFLPLYCTAQTDCAIRYSETIRLDSTEQTVLYDRGLRWFNQAFEDEETVLQTADRQSGELIARVAAPFEPASGTRKQDARGRISYLVRMSFTDGVCLVDVSEFSHEASASNANPESLGAVRPPHCFSNTTLEPWKQELMSELREQVHAIGTGITLRLSNNMHSDPAALGKAW